MKGDHGKVSQFFSFICLESEYLSPPLPLFLFFIFRFFWLLSDLACYSVAQEIPKIMLPEISGQRCVETVIQLRFQGEGFTGWSHRHPRPLRHTHSCRGGATRRCSTCLTFCFSLGWNYHDLDCYYCELAAASATTTSSTTTIIISRNNISNKDNDNAVMIMLLIVLKYV